MLRKVLLTRLGGCAFGTDLAWITLAIEHALACVAGQKSKYWRWPLNGSARRSLFRPRLAAFAKLIFTSDVTSTRTLVAVLLPAPSTFPASFIE